MQVYRIEPKDRYCGGSALIAAKSTDEAIKTFCFDEYRSYIYEEYNCTCNIIVGLDYDTSVPQIIFNDIYIE
jgi:hypothetical protein